MFIVYFTTICSLMDNSQSQEHLLHKSWSSSPTFQITSRCQTLMASRSNATGSQRPLPSHRPPTLTPLWNGSILNPLFPSRLQSIPVSTYQKTIPQWPHVWWHVEHTLPWSGPHVCHNWNLTGYYLHDCTLTVPSESGSHPLGTSQMDQPSTLQPATTTFVRPTTKDLLFSTTVEPTICWPTSLPNLWFIPSLPSLLVSLVSLKLEGACYDIFKFHLFNYFPAYKQTHGLAVLFPQCLLLSFAHWGWFTILFMLQFSI